MPNPSRTADSTDTTPGLAVDELLAKLRGELRAAIRRRLVWQAAAFAGLALWLGLVLDRLFEPSATFRGGVGLVLLGVVLVWLSWAVVPRLWRRIRDRELLTLLHHRHPDEANLLATALDLRSQPDAPNPRLVAESIAAADEAARSLHDVRLDRPASTMGLAWFATAALGGALLLGVARGDLARCFVDRVALSERTWPRRVDLVAEGFTFDESSGEWSLIAPRGEPLEFSVLAETSPVHPLPRTVWARGGAAGRRALTTFTRVGEPLVSTTSKRQRFRRRIERLDADQTLTITGGDARLRLRIIAAARPRLAEIEIACRPPAYRNTPSFTTEPTTLTPLPEGSELALSATATKPIASVEALITANSAPQPIEATLADKGQLLTIRPPRLDVSSILTIAVTDTDGLTSEPVDIPLEVAPDTPPTMRLTLNGVGRSITRDARLPVLATVDDDHGLASVALQVRRDNAEPVTLEMALPITLPGEATGEADLLTLRSASDGEKLSVEPGDHVTLIAEVSDRYDLSPRKPVASQPLSLEVVAPAELLARLGDAQRELRRGVDALLADVERLEYEIDLGQRQFAEGDPPSEAGLERWASERLLDTRKASDGIAGIAERADSLRQQVVNNRLDQPALIDRLATAVVRPLRRVVRRDLETTEKRLLAIEPTSIDMALSDAAASTRRAAETLQRVAASLDSQQTYNEVVSLLRGLIREQRTVNERTTRREAEEARSLLLD